MSKIKYDKYENAEGLVKLIASVAGHYTTARNRAQVAAVHILLHAAKHGDYTQANNLVEAVGKGGNQQAMIKWLTEFGGFTVDADDSSKGFTGWVGKQHIADNLEQAKGTMFWDYAPKNPYKGFDLAEELTKLITKAEGAIAKAEKGDEDIKAKVVVDVALLKVLRQVDNSVTVQ